MKSSRDTLYADTLADPGLFTFDQAVVGVFPDMIQRSVPGYATVIAMTGLLAARHARPGTRIYDLGCSLGASLISVARHQETTDCEIIGIDKSEAMLTGCRETLDRELPDAISHWSTGTSPGSVTAMPASAYSITRCSLFPLTSGWRCWRRCVGRWPRGMF